MSRQHKRSTITGKIPKASDIDVGEIAINLTDQILYTRKPDDTIIPVSLSPLTGLQGKANVFVSEIPPASAIGGDLWFNSQNGRLMVYYVDDDSSQWIEASPSALGSAGDADGSTGDSVQFSESYQGTPVEGTLWFDTGSNKLKIYDFDNSQWIDTISFNIQVIDNLTTNSTSNALSANQGLVLSDRIGDLSSLNTTDKTSLVGSLNELETSVSSIDLDFSDEDLNINGKTAGEGGGSLAGNTVFGNSSLESNTTGNQNSAFGFFSLRKNTTGSWNSAFGHGSLEDNTEGFQNTGIGYSALHQNTGGSSNTGVGYNSLTANTTGANNSSLGSFSLQSNTIGQSNSGFGSSSLKNNTTANHNSGFGQKSLELNTTGSFNTALGSQSLRFNQTGSSNTGIGYGALEDSTGSNNTSLGYLSLGVLQIGSNNVGIGESAISQMTSGNNNVGLGAGVLSGVTNAENNTALGNLALGGNTGSGNIAVGYGAGSGVITTNNIFIGDIIKGDMTPGTSRILGLEAPSVITPGDISGPSVPAFSVNATSLWDNLNSGNLLAVGRNMNTNGGANEPYFRIQSDGKVYSEVEMNLNLLNVTGDSELNNINSNTIDSEVVTVNNTFTSNNESIFNGSVDINDSVNVTGEALFEDDVTLGTDETDLITVNGRFGFTDGQVSTKLAEVDLNGVGTGTNASGTLEWGTLFNQYPQYSIFRVTVIGVSLENPISGSTVGIQFYDGTSWLGSEGPDPELYFLSAYGNPVIDGSAYYPGPNPDLAISGRTITFTTDIVLSGDGYVMIDPISRSIISGEPSISVSAPFQQEDQYLGRTKFANTSIRSSGGLRIGSVRFNTQQAQDPGPILGKIIIQGIA